MSIISKSAQLGIHTVVYLATSPSGGRVPAHVIAGQLDESPTYLAKIVQKLVKGNFLNSFRGPDGGLSLAAPADGITLLQIVEAIDGDSLFTACMLGYENCGQDDPCALHDKWGPVRETLRQQLSSMTVADAGTHSILDH